MTHDARYRMEHYRYSYCDGSTPERLTEALRKHIAHFDTNNMVVLYDERKDILFCLDGDLFGIDKKTSLDVVIKRTLPIFRLLILSTARSYKEGYSCGETVTRAEIRRALGVGK